jgi:hypothetical protein
MLLDCVTEFATFSVDCRDSLPMQTYRVNATRGFPRQAAFGENGTIVACGSDHGRIYIFDQIKGTVIDILHYSKSRVGTVTVCANFSRADLYINSFATVFYK